LYDAETKQQRQEWFQEWLLEYDTFDQEAILAFHQQTDKGTEGTTLKMKRPYVETVSVTSVKKEQQISMDYIDFRNKTETQLVF
jgi:hypothetical protein